MKQTWVTEEKVLAVLKTKVGETLRIDENSINPEHSLIKELGTESLDFLDINYQLERSFGIKMPRRMILEHVEEIFGEGSAVDEDSRLTAQGAALLKIRFGDTHSELKPGMDFEQIPTLVTIRLLAEGVLEILDTLPNTCSPCGQSAWVCEDGSHIKCGQCGEKATFTNGDQVIKQWLQQIHDEHHIFS